MNKQFFTLIVTLLLGSTLYAARGYQCDFENDSINALWTLNPGAMAASGVNKWYIGHAGNNGGRNGLFISNDGGQTATYTATGNCLAAYTEITLDASKADYIMTFDYRAMGNVNSKTDGLYACWIPMTDDDGKPINIVSVMNSVISKQYSNYLIELQPDAQIDNLYATSNWRTCKCYIPGLWCDGTPHRLVFLWLNGTAAPGQPGACVDNIDIFDARPCDAPTDLTTTTSGSMVTLHWSGQALGYEVSAYAYESDTWYGPYYTTDTSYVFSGMAAGYVDFYVRTKCDEDLYSTKVQHGGLVYYPDELCIDYLGLSKARCYVNSTPVTSTAMFNSYTSVKQPIDQGPYSIASRHTVHYNKREYDPRTGNKLRTIPDGNYASVRLGNWEVGSEAERIDYTFMVDSLNYPVLLLKYAVVIEAPGHGVNDDPRFKLDIMKNGYSIGSCTSADFNANDVYQAGSERLFTKDTTWHITPKEVAVQGGAHAAIVWKDWTTVGINLAAYHGSRLTVRLETLDCTAGGHAGYAYFTLGCSDGKLQGLKCGEINPDFTAPDGFVYRWMLRSDEAKRRPDGSVPEQYILGRDQHFEALVGDDGIVLDSVYAVDCMYAGDTTCYFTLYASPLANTPVAQMDDYTVTPDCKHEQYKVAMHSTSYVQQVDHITNDTTIGTQRLDGVIWDFGDGQQSHDPNAVHVYPSTGGEYTCTLTAILSTCTDVKTFKISLPRIGAVRDTAYAYLCDSSTYTWHGKVLNAYGTYHDTTVTSTDCDSIATLILQEPLRDTVHAFILDNQTYLFHGRILTARDTIAPVIYRSPDCDSVQVLILSAHTVLRAEVDTLVTVCADQTTLELPYRIIGGVTDRYSVTFSSGFDPVTEQKLPSFPTGVIEMPIPQPIVPNRYHATVIFYDSVSGNVLLPVAIDVRYASSILAQRWNDVIGIQNSNYNGGYTFTDYQWYKNGLPLLGETKPYLYEQPALDFTAVYAVMLTRATDGTKVMTCPLQPSRVAEPDMPTLVRAGQSIPARIDGQVSWMNTYGAIVSTATVSRSEYITAPSIPGMYILVVTQTAKTEHQQTVYRIVVQ